MADMPVSIIDSPCNAKYKVVLRFNKRDAQIARNWQDSAKNDR